MDECTCVLKQKKQHQHQPRGKVRERLAKRKQWISFNLIQLIYGKRENLEAISACCTSHYPPSFIAKPLRKYVSIYTYTHILLSWKRFIKLTQMSCAAVYLFGSVTLALFPLLLFCNCQFVTATAQWLQWIMTDSFSFNNI